jgi:glycerol-3-phosphate acyltransferase PlsY
MFTLTKIIHVLAVGLWFGAGIFFTFVVALSLFDTFEKETAVPPEKRPYWLPAPSQPDKQHPSSQAEEKLGKEQGSRIAGTAVGPIFRPYFILQVACGLLAGLSALTWFARGGSHKFRTIIILLALGGASAGWWLEQKVEALREERSTAAEAVLTSKAPTAEQKQADESARANFGTWHAYSLFANLGSLALVTVAMVMTAFLPNKPDKP